MHSPLPDPTPTELRHFGYVMAAAFAGIFGVLLPWLFGRAWPVWPWILAATFALPALFAPAWLAPVRRGWLAVGGVLGWINTRILLSAMFYFVVLPVGLVMRLAGRDPMRRSTSTDVSYRQPSPEREVGDMERPF